MSSSEIFLPSGFDLQAQNYSMLPTSQKLALLCNERLRHPALNPDEFDSALQKLISQPGFRWNHNFMLNGRSSAEIYAPPNPTPGIFGEYRYTNILSLFVDYFQFDLNLFKHASVWDVGPWTGLTSVIAEELGALFVDISEIEPIPLSIIAFLKKSFGFSFNSKPDVYLANESLKYDLVLNFGVIYHVTDPFIFLRKIFNSLRPGGTMLLETQALPRCISDMPILGWEGYKTSGANWFNPNGIALQNILEDVGFSDIRYAYDTTDASADCLTRIVAIAKKPTETFQVPHKHGWSQPID